MNIFWGNQKTYLFKGFLGKMCLLASPATPSTSTHPRFTLELFEKDTLKGKGDQRSKNPRSNPSSAHSWRFLKGALWKDNGIRKVGIQDLPSKVHNCRFLNRKPRKEKHMRKVGIQGLPSKVHSLELFEKTLVKGKRDEKEPATSSLYTIYSLPRCNGCRHGGVAVSAIRNSFPGFTGFTPQATT